MPREPRHDLRRGAALMVVSALLFAVMGACVKVASRALPNPMVVFLRNALGLVALLPWLRRLGEGGLRTAHLAEHLVRGLAGTAAMYCFFYAIAHLRLADAVLLNYSLPLFVPFIERLWLGERIDARLWPALLLGFAGIALILKPGHELFDPAALVGLLAALLAALAQVGVRRLTLTEPTIRIVFYFGVVSTLASALPLPWAWRTPPMSLAWVLAILGLSATFGQLFLTKAYAQAPAAQVGPFVYATVVFAATIDVFVFGVRLDPGSIAGALLVVCAGILALRLVRPAIAPAA